MMAKNKGFGIGETAPSHPRAIALIFPGFFPHRPGTITPTLTDCKGYTEQYQAYAVLSTVTARGEPWKASVRGSASAQVPWSAVSFFILCDDRRAA